MKKCLRQKSIDAKLLRLQLARLSNRRLFFGLTTSVTKLNNSIADMQIVYFGFVVFGLISFGYFFVNCQEDFFNMVFTIFSGKFLKNFSGMFLVLKITLSNLEV